MYICEFCNKECKNPGSFSTHVPYCKLNPNRIQRKTNVQNNGFKKGYTPWNKGVGNGHPAWNKGLTGISTGKGSTEEKEILRKKRISEKAKINNGGYRKGSGIGKKGYYKYIWCDSSWELAYVLYCLDNNIKIERNKEKRSYEFEGSIRSYIPDFVVEGKIVEIKGYKSPQWEAKYKENQDILVLFEDDLKEIFTYVKLKYGPNFTSMYQNLED